MVHSPAGTWRQQLYLPTGVEHGASEEERGGLDLCLVGNSLVCVF